MGRKYELVVVYDKKIRVVTTPDGVWRIVGSCLSLGMNKKIQIIQFRLTKGCVIALLVTILSGFGFAQSPPKGSSAHTSSANEVMAVPLNGVLFEFAPRLVRKTPVKIPAAEKRRHLNGVVVIRLIIEASGNPSDPEITRNTTGSNVLAVAAVTAAMQSKYAPATMKKQAVRSSMMIPYVF